MELLAMAVDFVHELYRALGVWIDPEAPLEHKAINNLWNGWARSVNGFDFEFVAFKNRSGSLTYCTDKATYTGGLYSVHELRGVTV